MSKTTNHLSKMRQHTGTSPRKTILLTLTSFFLLIGLLYGLYYFFFARFYQATDDAYVSGNVVALTPQINGVVTAINADTTNLVLAGQKVVILDPNNALLVLKQSEAILAQTVRQLRQNFLQVDQLAALVDERNADLKRAESTPSTEKGNDQIKQTVTAAKAALTAAQKQHQAAKALVQNTTLETHPAILKARFDVEKAYLAWKHTDVIAPVSGYIAKRNVQVGQQVAAGQNLLAIVPLSDVWIEANFRESQLVRIRIGQPVEIISDLYGSAVKYHGQVVGISAGSGSVFSLLPPQNANGNWVKVIQRVPVKISLDPEELKKHPLFLGLSTSVSVNTHDLKGAVLTSTPADKPLYETTVFNDALKEAKTVADNIIREQIKASAL